MTVSDGSGDGVGVGAMVGVGDGLGVGVGVAAAGEIVAAGVPLAEDDPQPSASAPTIIDRSRTRAIWAWWAGIALPIVARSRGPLGAGLVLRRLDDSPRAGCREVPTAPDPAGPASNPLLEPRAAQARSGTTPGRPAAPG